MKSLKITLLACLLIPFGKLLSAEPMFIYFHEMINQSKLIVKGTYLGSDHNDPYNSFQCYFMVEDVLKGKAEKEKMTFNRANGAIYLEPGTEYIAFINENNGFEWVGIDKMGKKITEESLLFLQGFYDYNAYLVSPGVISYKQLKDYLVNSSYTGIVYGDVHFFDMKEQNMKPSNIHIEVKYTVIKDKITSEVFLNGIALNDFIKKPLFGIPCWDDIVTVEYESNLVRPLTFQGKLNDLHPSAYKWRATFWVHEPEELSYEELLQYIGNEAHGPGYFDLEMQLENQKNYIIRLNEETGRTGRLLNYEGKNLSISSLSTAPQREIVFGYPDNLYKLVLDSCKVAEKEFEYAEDDLVFELKHGSVKGNFIDLKTNKTIGPCVLTYKKTGFTKNLNYGK